MRAVFDGHADVPALHDAIDGRRGSRTARDHLGANPLAILIPCHRVTRGRELPDEYVGGAERRLALCELERS
jgi:AraC family transcriptional regulator of adaptative response/methylated-DNA-[protein]-cysteine methyltransferase